MKPKTFEQYKELQEKYDELLEMTRQAMGFLASLNGDLGFEQVSDLIEKFEEFDSNEV